MSDLSNNLQAHGSSLNQSFYMMQMSDFQDII